MPQLGPAVLTDSSDDTTPHTFVPKGIDKNGVVMLVEHSGVPIADRRISLGRSETANGRIKTTIKFVYPIVQNQSVNGVNVPTVVRTGSCNVDISVDQTSSLAERREISLAFNKLIQSSAWGPWFEDYLLNLEGLY